MIEKQACGLVMHAEKNNSEPFAKPPLRGLPGIAFPTFAHHGFSPYSAMHTALFKQA